MEGFDDNFLVERLREMVVALLQRLELMLPPQAAASSPPGAPPPQGSEWAFRLLCVLLVVVTLAALIYYAFFRGGERWGRPTKMLMKPPRGAGPPTLYEHEGIVAAIAMLALILLSLGGLYYYYCYQAGCFGDGERARAVTAADPGPASRKLKLI